MAKRRIIVAGGVAALLCAFLLRSHGGEPAVPAAGLLREAAFEAEGDTYSIVNGEAYKLDKGSGKWSHFDTVYDPDFFKKNYVVEKGVVHRKADDGRLFEVLKQFESGFEDVKSMRELIGEKYKWTACTLQSPAAPEVKDYVDLRNRILKDNAPFIDNRIEPTAGLAHSGKQSLKFYSVAPSRGMICSKASLDTGFLHFVKGDDFWFSGWYFVKEGWPQTLLDLECSFAKGYPGIRLYLFEDKYLGAELKWAHKPKFKQAAARTAFPASKWVNVVAHFKLSEKPDGIVQIWQDGKQVVDAKGQTLAFADAVYDNLEVGITANQQTSTLYVDDIKVTDKPLLK
jgi:hypothetical protein